MSLGDMGASEQVVETVAAEEECNPVELPPFGESIDADAVNSIIATLDEGKIAFSYHGKQISITADQTIEIRDPQHEGRKGKSAISD